MTRRPTRELVLCFLALVVLAAIVYGGRIAHGSFAWDDWQNALYARFGAESVLSVGPFDLREALYEPGIALLIPLPHLAFGLEASWDLALAALLGVAMSVAAFALLRELGLAVLPSLAVAALVLLFPWSDSTRLWAAGGLDQVAGGLYLAGAAVAVRGLGSDAPRDRRLKRMSLALYAASLLTYPAATLLVGVSTLVYRLRVPWRAAWERGRWDLGLAAGALAFDALVSTKPVSTPGGDINHAWTIVDQWLTVLARSLEPFGRAPRGWVLLGAGALALVCGFAARRRRPQSAAAPKRWLWVAAAGAAWALAAYAIFALGEDKYVPLAPGLYNRVGMLAAPGFALSVIGLAGATAELVAGGRRSRRSFAAVLSAALATLVAVGWAARVGDDVERWDQAAAESRRALSAVQASAPPSRPGLVLYVSGYEHYVAPGYPVFAASFDLDSALKVAWDDPNVDAYPLPGPLSCGETAVAPRLRPYDELERPAPYGDVALIDVAAGTATVLDSRAQCRRVVP